MLNRQLKDSAKKMKKLKSKNEKKISNVADVLEGFTFGVKKEEDDDDDDSAGEDKPYDFGADFKMG